MVKRIPERKKEKKKPPLFFCFGEVSNISRPVLSALRRVTRLLRHEPVQTFPVSTESQLFDLAPPARGDAPNGIREADPNQVAPFYAFELDMTVEQLMATDMAAELRMSLDDTGAVSHIINPGRPL